MPISIKSPKDIKKMKKGGEIASAALKACLSEVKAGISLAELNEIAEDIITKKGGKPSFKMVEDYSYATCINVNEGIVHGVPGNYRLKKGDLVSVDLGVYLEGLHTDLSYTVEVETDKEKRFLDTGREALAKAIEQAREGNRIGDISHTIQEIIEKAGYSVSRDLVGHGIGRELHEDPFVPCYGNRKEGPVLREGMVFAIEVIYQKGDPRLALDEDDWTLRTADNSLSGLFESTVAVTKDGPLVLTSL
jgi:methionyl aminopeptidase